MLSDKLKRVVQLTIILGCVILASIFLSPLLNNSTKASGLFGMVIGLLISIAIFPDTVKDLFKEQTKLRKERLKDELALGFRRSLAHPIRLPMTIGILWFVVFILLIVIAHPITDRMEDKSVLQLAFFIPPLFLFGLTGLVMILKKEGIDRHGRKYFGKWVYVNGTLQMLFCWGLAIVFALATVLHW